MIAPPRRHRNHHLPDNSSSSSSSHHNHHHHRQPSNNDVALHLIDGSTVEWRLKNDYVQTPVFTSTTAGGGGGGGGGGQLGTQGPPRLTPVVTARPANAYQTSVEFTSAGGVVTLPVSPPNRPPSTATENERTDAKNVVKNDPQLPCKQTGNASGFNSAGTCGGGGSGVCGGGGGGGSSSSSSAYICPRCHRCRCSRCTGRRELPRRWCGSYDCSADGVVDCLTCMCCVRATFYHCCADAEEETDYADDPCACRRGHPRCCLRWVVIVLIALFLPCLVLYWPCRGAVALAAECYNACGGRRGCRCDRRPGGRQNRPLIEAENSSV